MNHQSSSTAVLDRPVESVRVRALSVYGTRALAVLVALMGVGNILSAWFARGPGRWEVLRQVLPLQVIHGSRTLAAAAGVFLILTSRGLWRHKRRSWELSIIFLAASVPLHLTKGLDYEEALVSLVILLLLAIYGPYYQVRSDPPSLRQGLTAILVSTAAVLLYGALGFRALGLPPGVQPGPAAEIRAVMRVFYELSDMGPIRAHGRRRWFVKSIHGVALLTYVYAFAMITRPLVPRKRAAEDERGRAEQILQQWACTDIASFALLDDKHYLFLDEGEGVLAYKVAGGCAIALGDPVGPPESVGMLARMFLEMCRRSDWRPVFAQTTPQCLPLPNELGLRYTKIGEDAVINLREFSITGNRGAGFRYTINSLEKQGVRAVRYDLAKDELGLMGQLEEISSEWLAMHKGSEKTFSLGYWDPLRISRYPLMVALDSRDRALAFETLVPMYGANGWAGDLMRRRPDSPRGVMDYVIVKQALALKHEGYDVYGQGLCPLSTREIPGDEGQALADRVIELLYEHFNTFYGFKGLHDWKAKFHPRWESRYLVYTSPARLPQVALAIVRADSTDSMLSFLRRG